MLKQRNWVASIIALLLVVAMSACAAGGVAVPDRPVDISVENALAAQGKLGNLMMGSVEWSESEFSSLLSVLLEQNSGEGNPVTGITVWFESDNRVIIRVAVVDNLTAFGNTLDLAGSISVVNNQVVVDLDAAGVGGTSISGGILDVIAAQINAALADPSLGVPVNVTTGSGTISLSLGM